MDASLTFEGVAKTFVPQLQRGNAIDVIVDASFSVEPHDCAVLTGPSGAGKSTLLRLAYGNHRADRGRMLASHGDTFTNIAAGDARLILNARRRTIGYVSQYRSVIPRVAAKDLVGAAAEAAGHADPRAMARDTLARLHLPEPLWQLPPATFSGGERQRVNIAISVVGRHPILLLNEPPASLDAQNRDVVVELIREKRASGCSILAVFHDAAVGDALAARRMDFSEFAPARSGAA